MPNLLTRQHREVMRLAVKGLSTDEIADTLFISRETVRGYFRGIYLRLDVHSRLEAIRHVEAHADLA